MNINEDGELKEELGMLASISLLAACVLGALWVFGRDNYKPEGCKSCKNGSEKCDCKNIFKI